MDFLRLTLAAIWSAVSAWSWQRWLLVAVFLAGVMIGGCVCNRWHDLVGTPGPMGSTGWLPAPESEGGLTRQVVASTLPRPLFADAAAGLAAPEKDALLYLAPKQVTGRHLPAHDQDGTGCCVGEGFSYAIEILECVEITRGEQQEFKPVSAAAVYALSREVGGLLGKGDGSFGSAAAKAVTTFGVVSSEDAGDDNTTGREHASLAKKWGQTGLPKELKAKAKDRTVKTSSLVKSAEECRTALVNGYPIAICSDVGFEPTRRDSDGFCRAGGQWYHCMAVVGYRTDKRAFLVAQSWGAGSPTGPLTLDQPSNTFWITWQSMERIAKQGDSYALSAFSGFPARNVDYFVVAPKLDRDQSRRAMRRLAPWGIAWGIAW